RSLFPPSPFHTPAPRPDLPSFPTRRSSDLLHAALRPQTAGSLLRRSLQAALRRSEDAAEGQAGRPENRQAGKEGPDGLRVRTQRDRKSTRLNSSHDQISYAVFCLKKKKKKD